MDDEIIGESRGKVGLLACNAGIPLRDKILNELQKIHSEKSIPLKIGATKTKEQRFADSEIKVEIEDSVRGQDVYIIQDIANNHVPGSVDEKFRALKLMINAARNSDAHYITAIIPAFPYARQDKQVSRESIGAKVAAQELCHAGVNRVLTLDIHARQIAGFFDNGVTLWNVYAADDVVLHIKDTIELDNLVVAAPDAGAAGRATKYAEKLKRPFAGIIYKQRDYSIPNSKPKMFFAGDVKDKDVLLVDDMIDTGGTAVEAMRQLKNYFAKRIYFACALPLFNGEAVEKLRTAHSIGVLEKVIGTDGVYHNQDFLDQNSWYTQVTIAHKFARLLFNINHDLSISKLLD